MNRDDFEKGREVFRKYLQQFKLPEVIFDPPPMTPKQKRSAMKILRALRRLRSKKNTEKIVIYIDEE